ncbi:oligosaccharide flippase family protein [Streptomyces sp. NPDC006540]|jgi:O-antigen/teichoic acid export membrane protein|uniref:oligosaccharide flippase family protein n=1 Tax=Streptomyces sp. NPDC006540 TaxID=3155353 RepID=UPI0033A138DB
MTTARSAVHSLLWNFAGAAQAVILQLGYTALTARLVEPATFGAYAIAAAALGILAYFANGGVSVCLLRARRLTRPLTRLALRTTAVTGCCCFVAAQLAAPAVGLLWDMEGLVSLVRLLSTQFLVTPMSLAATAALRRCGHAARVVRLELLGQASGFGLSLTLLVAGWSPYALAVATPLAAAVVLAGSLRLLAAQPLPDGPRPPLAELLGPSTFFTGFSLVQYGCNTAPLWLVGALFGPAATGYYSRASLFTQLPVAMLAQGINRAAAPALTESRGSKGEYDTLCGASAIGLIGFGAIAGVGPALLGVLLGPGWESAGRLVPLLAVGAAFSLLAWVGDSINQVRQAPGAMVGSQLAAVLAIACSLFAAFRQESLSVLLAAAVAGPLAAHAVQLVCWGGPLAIHVLRAHAAHAAVGGAVFGVCHAGLVQGPYLGLMAALPLVAGVALLRDRLPAYAVARRRGLIRLGRGTIGSHAVVRSSDRP